MTSTETLVTATTPIRSEFVLLVGPGGAPWRRAVEQLSIPVLVDEICAQEWTGSYRMSASGAILIGPDGTVVMRQRGLNVCIAPPELALFGSMFGVLWAAASSGASSAAG